MDFDETRLYYSHQQLQLQQQQQQQTGNPAVGNNAIHNTNHNVIDENIQEQLTIPTDAMRRHFREFFRNYRFGGGGSGGNGNGNNTGGGYIYRNRLLKMYHRSTTTPSAGTATATTTATANSIANPQYYYISVQLEHVSEYDVSLLHYIRYHPMVTIPIMETAAAEALQTMMYSTQSGTSNNINNRTRNNDDSDDDDDEDRMGMDRSSILHQQQEQQPTLPPVQILLRGDTMPYTSLRNIHSQHIHRLLYCSGIVVSTSPIKYRATHLFIRCIHCADTQIISSTTGSDGSNNSTTVNYGPFGSFQLPQWCKSANTTNIVQQQGPDGQVQAVANTAVASTCPMYPYVVVPDNSTFIDIQTIKVQETHDRVPVGEMPRSVLCTMERSALIDVAPPGTRISILCIPTLYNTYNNNSGKGRSGSGSNNSNNNATTKSVYLRVVGIQKENGSTNGKNGLSFTPSEEEAFHTLSTHPNLYNILLNSIAPNIKGSYTIDIKKALLCQLFSGCRKSSNGSGRNNSTGGGVQLRGDINILLLGDPSMAKSQFLKFISQVAPIGIYTSGKGSSAAGLTASVVKDPKGEFYLEGGAMVLADGGIVCIDEFDKMRSVDRVAIHEAMEQQTISIAKAGITTVLNSRTSVLAAANPVYGRYDDYKSASDNIDLMTTILSRFDMIFLVRDIREEERDRLICQHVMGVHIDHSSSSSGGGNTNGMYGSARNNNMASVDMNNGNNNNNFMNNINDPSAGADDSSSEAIADHVLRIASTGTGELSIPAMKKYIQYCKMKCSPRLSEEAGNILTSSYVRIRDDIRKQSLSVNNNGSGESTTTTVIPITVRQLEALVRISESLAKMRMDSIVRVEDVTEALRLFSVSTMTAANTSSANANPASTSFASTGANNNVLPTMNRDELDRTEAFVRSRLNISGNSSSSTNYMNRQRFLEECIGQGYNAMTVSRIIHIMIGRGEIIEKNSGRLLKRVK